MPTTRRPGCSADDGGDGGANGDSRGGCRRNGKAETSAAVRRGEEKIEVCGVSPVVNGLVGNHRLFGPPRPAKAQPKASVHNLFHLWRLTFLKKKTYGD
jgi:hypothetical protein